MWHVSVSLRQWGVPVPRARWNRQQRRAVEAYIERCLKCVGEGELMWAEEIPEMVLSMQARRSLNDREIARLPQHKLPEFWTEEDERRWRRGERDA